MTDLLYLRFSTDEQTADAQRADIPMQVLDRIAGDCTFTDPGVSGSVPALEREGFRSLLLKAEPGDTIHVAWFDRLMRPEKMSEAELVISTLRGKGLALKAHDFPLPDLTADDEMAELTWKILAAVAGMERRRIARRRDAGIRAAKAEGKHMGRPRQYTAAQAAEVLELAEGDRSVRSIARTVGLSTRTVGRIIKEDRADGSNGTAAQVDSHHRTGQAGAFTVSIPGVCVDALRRFRTAPEEALAALDGGRKFLRGSGYQLVVTATAVVHRALWDGRPSFQSGNDRRALRKWEAALAEVFAAPLEESVTCAVEPVAAVVADEAPAVEPTVEGEPVKISLPGKVVEFLRDLEDEEITETMAAGTANRARLLLTVPTETHRWLLARADGMAGVGGEATPAEKRAWNEYARLIEGAEKFAAQQEAAPMEGARPVRKAKAGHAIYTAPDGTTRESKRAYTAALAVFNPAEAIKAPWIESFHGTAALASKAGQGFARMGYRFMIVPVTTDGTTDADLAARIAALRTEADTANIPAQEVATAEAKRDRAAADVARYQERKPDARFGETAETLAGWLAKAEEERDTAAATADHWRAQLASA